MANDLDVPQLTEGQASPEVTTNDATAALGDALANVFDCDLSAGNVSVTAAQYRGAVLFTATGVATGGRTLTLPLVEREFVLVECSSSNTNDISLIRGSTTLTLAPGRLYLVRTDGTTDGLVARDVGGVNEQNDFHVFLPGVMANAQLCFRLKATRAFTLPVSLTGSFVTATIAATASTTITLKKAGASIGTAVFGIGGTTAALTFASAVSFAAGDVFTVEGPATADATLANVSLDLKGTR